MAVSAPPAPRAARRPRTVAAVDAITLSARATAIALAAIVAVYLLTRLLLVWRFPPFWDELGYGEWAKGAAQGSSTRWLSMLEGKEPLTSWLGALWIHLGVGYLTAVRLVSVVAGVITLAMLWLIGSRITRPVALLAMALYAVLPLFVVADAQGIMEPTITAEALCALYCAIRLAERPSVDMSLLLGLALGAGLLTKQSGDFAVALTPVTVLLVDLRRAGRVGRLVRWAGGLALAGIVCAACYSILMLSPLWRTYRQAHDGFHRPLGDVLRHPYAAITAHSSSLADALAGYLGPLLGLAVVAGLVLMIRSPRRRLALVLGAWGLAPFVASMMLAPQAYPRYWEPPIAALLLPMALGTLAAFNVARRQTRPGVSRHAGRGLLAVALAGLPLVLLVSVLAHPGTAHYPGEDDAQYVTSWSAGTGWPQVTRDIEAETRGQPFTIAFDRARPLFWMLSDRERAQQFDIASGVGATAKFLVKNYPTPPLTPQEQASFRLLHTYSRPRGGEKILLYVHR